MAPISLKHPLIHKLPQNNLDFPENLQNSAKQRSTFSYVRCKLLFFISNKGKIRRSMDSGGSGTLSYMYHRPVCCQSQLITSSTKLVRKQQQAPPRIFPLLRHQTRQTRNHNPLPMRSTFSRCYQMNLWIPGSWAHWKGRRRNIDMVKTSAARKTAEVNAHETWPSMWEFRRKRMMGTV